MNNKIRIVIIGVLLAIVFSLSFFIFPVTTHLIIAYVFALIGILGLVLSAIFLARKGMRIPQDIPYLSTAWTYLIISIVVSVVGVALQAFYSPIILLVIHILILTIFLVWFIVLSGGKEYIDTRVDKTAENIFNIRMMLGDLDAIKEKVNDLPEKEIARKEVGAVYDALRFADPVNNSNLIEYDDAIKESIILLDRAVSEGDLEKIQNISIKLQRQIKDRNNRIKIMK